MQRPFAIPLCRPSITAAELDGVADALRSGWLTQGPKTAAFESGFARYIGVPHAIAMNSCTSALFLALVAAGIRGEVILPSFTFVASANAIVTAGATAVFADIDPVTFNLDTAHVESLITPRTEAIMAVHYAGQPCRMDRLSALAERHGLLLIEDCAETIGGSFAGRKAGAFGVGCFSFFPTKNITTGEGGMLTTGDADLADKVRTLVAHGVDRGRAAAQPWQRFASLPGYNFRLSDVLAAIGIAQLGRIEAMNTARRDHAATLTRLIGDTPGVVPPTEDRDCRHVHQMYVLNTRDGVDRDALIARLRAGGIEASVHFDPPVHLQPAHARPGTVLPVTEAASRSVLTLPMFPDLTPGECQAIAGGVRAALGAAPLSAVPAMA